MRHFHIPAGVPAERLTAYADEYGSHEYEVFITLKAVTFDETDLKFGAAIRPLADGRIKVGNGTDFTDDPDTYIVFRLPVEAKPFVSLAVLRKYITIR